MSMQKDNPDKRTEAAELAEMQRIDMAIAKAKEQSCSTLCHPEEECFITESGKCEAKEE